MSDPGRLSAAEFSETAPAGWRVVLGMARAEFEAPSFTAAGELVSRIAAAADEANHHPDVQLHYPGRVRVAMTTHDVGGLSTLDLELARTVASLAGEIGAEVRPTAPQAIELAIDTMDADAIRPFWAAVLGYRDTGDDVVDPAGIGPSVWFQQLTEPRPIRNRIHVDVSVPHDEAADRIEAALAAGGRMVDDERAEAFWVLADADGNECCVCTWKDRD